MSNKAATPSRNINMSTSQKAEDMPQISKDGLPSDVAEYITELEKSLEEAADLIDELAADEDSIKDEIEEETEDEVKDEDKVLALAKSDPILGSFISKMQADLEESRKEIAKERQIRVVGEMVAKASAYDHLSISKSDLGTLFYKLYEVAPVEAAQVEEILKAANGQLESATLFGEIGKSTSSATSVGASAEALANEIKKEDPSLSIEQALAKAYEQNPSLYAEHLKGA